MELVMINIILALDTCRIIQNHMKRIIEVLKREEAKLILFSSSLSKDHRTILMAFSILFFFLCLRLMLECLDLQLWFKINLMSKKERGQ